MTTFRSNFALALGVFAFSTWLSVVCEISAASIDQSYQYDGLSRLATVGAATYQHDAAGNLLQITAPAPEIAVEQPAGTDISDGEAKDFGTVGVGSNASLTFTVRNTASGALTGLGITIDGTHASEFTVTAIPSDTVSGTSGTTTFTIRFSPIAGGVRTAALHLANNDSNESPFDITLTGTGSTGLANLAPYKQASWSAPVVVSKVTGDTTDSAGFTPTDILYVDWGVRNNGVVAATAFQSQLYVDGVLRQAWSSSSLLVSYIANVKDYSIGSLPVGTHTIRIVADSANALTETNEADNEYTKTITISADDHGGTSASATVLSKLTGFSNGILNPADDDYFRVAIPSAGVLIAWTEGETNTYGYLYNGTPTLLKEDGDSDLGNNFRVSADVAVGDCFIRVKGFDSATTGSYILRTRFIPSTEPFQITYLEKVGSTVNLGFTNPGPLTYYVQGSDNLEDWTDIQSAVGAGAEKIAVLSNQGVSSKRFFRVSTLPAPPAGFTLIPSGTFQLGDALDGMASAPLRNITLNALYLEKREVSKTKWDEVRTWGQTTGGYPDLAAGGGKELDHPVQTISWYDMVKWCNARSEKDGLAPCYMVGANVYRSGNSDLVVCDWTASGYRLPTEAEWERAARGGQSGLRFQWGNTISHTYANYRGNGTDVYDQNVVSGYHPSFYVGSIPYTSPVGALGPKGYGLYGMTGNVWERCWDWSGAYPSGDASNPTGPATGTTRILRGGGYGYAASFCRVAYRTSASAAYLAADVGFRVARKATLENF